MRWSLGGLLLLPPGLHFLGFGSSYALGLSLFAAMVLVLEFLLLKPTVSKTAVAVLLITTIILPLHLLIVSVANPTVSILWDRALLSLIVINLIILVTDTVARNALLMSADAFDRTITQLAVLLLILGFLSFVTSGIAFHILGLPSSIPPFSEPSHFTLALTPFAIYGLASRNRRIILLSLTFIPFMILEVYSSVFLILIVIITLIRVPIWLVPIAILGLIYLTDVILLLTQSILAGYGLEYYLDRLTFGYSENLSVLVYQQGIDLVKSAFTAEYLLGFGFQQLGTSDLGFDSTSRIQEILGGSIINTRDGSFLVAKLFGEFGILAVTMVAPLGFMIVVAFRNIQKHYTGRNRLAPQILFAYCCIYGFIIELIFRGIGYFSLGGTLLFCALFTLSRFKRAKRAQSYDSVNQDQ